jgi:hypothetical protein
LIPWIGLVLGLVFTYLMGFYKKISNNMANINTSRTMKTIKNALSYLGSIASIMGGVAGLPGAFQILLYPSPIK